MKLFAKSFIALLGLISFAGALNAVVIVSVNFYDTAGPLDENASVGVNDATGWLSFDNSNSITDQQILAGDSVPTTFSFVNSNPNNRLENNDAFDELSFGDDRLMLFSGNGLRPGTQTLTLNIGDDVPAEYNLYIYVADVDANPTGSNNSVIGTIALNGGDPINIQTPGDDVAYFTANGFSPITSTEPIGNYVLFEGVSTDTVTVVLSNTGGSNNRRLGFAGFEVTPVPEPSTYVFFAAAGILLLVVARRRRG